MNLNKDHKKKITNVETYLNESSGGLQVRLDGRRFSLQLSYPLVAMLTFCKILRKRDH